METESGYDYSSVRGSALELLEEKEGINSFCYHAMPDYIY